MSVEAARSDGFALLATYAGDAMINSTLYAASVSTIVVVLTVASVSVARQHPRLVKAQDALTWLGFSCRRPYFLWAPLALEPTRDAVALWQRRRDRICAGRAMQSWRFGSDCQANNNCHQA